MGLPMPLQENISARNLDLIELTLIYLGEKLPADRIFKIHKPGAIHNARFMSHSVYILKMELASDRLLHPIHAWLTLLVFFIQCNFSAQQFPYLLQSMTLNF